MIITIDGPTASGKSTVAKNLAKKLDFAYLNSGLLYRGIAYILVNFFNYDQASLASPKQFDLDQVIHNLEYLYEHEKAKVVYKDHDITAYLKTKEMDNYASISSACPKVRASLMSIQRKIGESQNIVAEGRDTGTVVFPQAKLKIFLTASLQVRAARWLQFMHNQGKDYTINESMAAVDARDQRDINRPIAPLIPAPDALIIDSSNLTIQQVLAQIIENLK